MGGRCSLAVQVDGQIELGGDASPDTYGKLDTHLHARRAKRHKRYNVRSADARVDATVFIQVNQRGGAGGCPEGRFGYGARRTGDGQHHAVMNRIGVAIQDHGAANAAGGDLNGVHDAGSGPFAEVGHTLDECRRRQQCGPGATYHQAALNHSNDSRSILNLTVSELLERLGSSDPAPGGGAAAAVVGALGAACVQMTANLSIGRPKLAGVEEQARSIATRAGELRQRLALLGDADTEAFEKVSAAYKLPRDDDAHKAARSAAIQAALQAAARVPLETARACADVLELAEEAAPILNAAVVSDVLVGALLAQAALESAALNVEVNLAAMTDQSAVERFSRDLEQARAGASERVKRVLEAGRSRLNKPVGKS